MVVVINRLTARDTEVARHVEDRFRDRLKAVDGKPGFLSFELWRDAEDPLTLSSVTRWRDRASFDAWVASPEFKAAHEKHRSVHAKASTVPGGKPPVTSHVTIHEVVDRSMKGATG